MWWGLRRSRRPARNLTAAMSAALRAHGHPRHRGGRPDRDPRRDPARRGYFATIALSVLSAALLIRYLGVDDFGRYATVIAIVTVLTASPRRG